MVAQGLPLFLTQLIYIEGIQLTGQLRAFVTNDSVVLAL